MTYLKMALVLLLIPVLSIASQTIQWTDYTSNPLNIPTSGLRVYMPTVLYDTTWGTASAYKMWFDYASNAGIAYSVSSDGINWTSSVIVTGIYSSGASPSGRPNVIYNPAWTLPYKMYYASTSNRWEVRVAESSNGSTWVNDTPSFYTGLSFPDGHCVLYDTTLTPAYQMFYWGTTGGTRRAVSTDGINFTDAGIACSTGCQPTSVLKIKTGDYRMWGYTTNTSIIYLTSSNGTSYSVNEAVVNTVGIVGAAGTWNSSRNYQCSVVYDGSTTCKMWRSGYNGSVYKVGYATGAEVTSFVPEWLKY